MIFIYDLDDTLLDTRSLKMTLFDIMKESGATIEEIEFSYNLFSGNGVYNPENHIKYIANNNKAINLAAFLERYNSIKYKDYLMPEAEKVLNESSTIGQNILFTKGDRSFQARKIIGANIDDFFQDIIITSIAKDEAIKDLKLNDKVIVFNDKMSENEAMQKTSPDWKFIATQNLINDWQKIKSEL